MLQKNWDRIVFISSESGVNIPVEMVDYSVTKTAQVALARGLAEATTGSRVTVNSVLPGPTRSEGVGRFVEDVAKGQGTDVARRWPTGTDSRVDHWPAGPDGFAGRRANPATRSMTQTEFIEQLWLGRGPRPAGNAQKQVAPGSTGAEPGQK